MRRWSLFVILAIFALIPVLTAGDALAAKYEHVRDGFLIGISLGGGSADLNFEDEAGRSVETDRESGGAGDFRVAYAIQPECALGVEASGWTKEVDGGTWTFSVFAAAVTYYPGAKGFFVRGGVGAGNIEFETRSEGVTITASDGGFGALGAIGYEWRLTKKFALGPQAEFAYMSVGDGVTANYFAGSASLNWYF
jgi:hypothetical protein